MTNLEADQPGSARRTPVSMEDVQAAVEQVAGGDPNATNASALRSELGKGSMTTIQKLLDKLREDVRKSRQPSDGTQARDMPSDIYREFETAIEALWWRAHDRVEGLLRTRLDAVTSDRDAWRDRAETAERDRAAVQEAHEDLETRMEAQAAAVSSVEKDLENQRVASASELAAAAAREAELVAKLDAMAKDAAQAAALAAAERRGLDATIDRLTEQLAEAKAMLRQRIEDHTTD
jgi:chromosome segregation ATPase